jgi:hypothetical protein
MGTIERVADRCMGYLGLFLIGAIGWMADRMGPVPQPAPRARARRVSHRTTRRAEA